MSEKLVALIEAFKDYEYKYETEGREPKGELTLYAADCAGYDITGAVRLVIKDNKIVLVRSVFSDDVPGYQELESIELVEKEQT